MTGMKIEEALSGPSDWLKVARHVMIETRKENIKKGTTNYIDRRKIRLSPPDRANAQKPIQHRSNASKKHTTTT